MITKMPSLKPNKMLVKFELPSSIWAETVHLVGDFNGWDQRSHAMMRDRADGTWYVVVELDLGREYQFRYLVNGSEWHNDWNADDYVANSFGGANSVVSTILHPPDMQRDGGAEGG